MDTRALPGKDRSVLKVIRISCAEEGEQRPRVVRGVLGSAVDERCGARSAASSLFSASLRPGYGYETRRGERRRDERCALIRASGAVLRNLTLVVVIAKINRDNHCFNLQVNL